jgi:hypothetical protein
MSDNSYYYDLLWRFMKWNLCISLSYISLLFYHIMMPTLPVHLVVPSTLLLAFCPFLLCYPRMCLSGLSNVYLFYCSFNVPEWFSYWKMWELCLVHKYDGVIVQNMLILKPQNEYKEELISVKSSSYSIVFNVTI